MGKSLTYKNVKRRLEYKSKLFLQGLSSTEIAKKLHTSPHNIRIQISKFRKNYPELSQILFPYKNKNNWLINRNIPNK